jgi:hypothetical protein
VFYSNPAQDFLQMNENDKVAWRVAEWSNAVGVSKTTVFDLIKADAVETFKLGRSRMITTSPQTFIQRMREKKTPPIDIAKLSE